MSYLFINRYCKITANLPELRNVDITGWIIQADELTLNILDEHYNHIIIPRENLVGSIVVIQDQKPVPEEIYGKQSA